MPEILSDLSADKSDQAVTAKAVQLLHEDASRELLAGLPAKLSAAPAEATGSAQRRSYLRTAINAGSSCIISSEETRDRVNQLGADFIKTASLFTRGKLGIAGTVVAYGLDQASPQESLGAQAADFALGGSKGVAMKGMFSAIGSGGQFVPLKGALMGMGAGAADEVFKRETFSDPSGLNDRLRRTAFNPQAVLMNVAVFTAGEGLYAGINHASRGALAENRLLSGMVMGGSFGFVNGSTQEAARQWQQKGSFNPGKVLLNGLLDGGVQAAAAGTGIKISDPVFQLKVKTTALNALDTVGLNPYTRVSRLIGGDGQSQTDSSIPAFPGTRNADLRHLKLSEPAQRVISERVRRNLTPFEKMTEKYEKVSVELKAAGLKDAPTAAELAALEIYSDGDYSRINPVLRGGKMALLDRILYPFGIGPGVSMEGITLLSASALNKLTPYEGTVYRESRLYGSELALYEPGKTVKELAFTSSSSETQGAAKRMGNTLFIIDSKTGKAIDRFSRHPREKEILFAPGTEYRVLSRQVSTVNGKPMTVVRMSEAE
jgi:hypothetical protein